MVLKWEVKLGVISAVRYQQVVTNLVWHAGWQENERLGRIITEEREPLRCHPGADKLDGRTSR